jgi:putative RecB family exonuclease
VLERLFDLPAGERTPEAAQALLEPQWRRMLAEEPELAALFVGDPQATADPQATQAPASEQAWLAGARELVARYFSLEDPRRLEPADRELFVEASLDDGLVLRGYVDRLDVAPDGAMRVVDYKTGRAPGVGFEARALFQMRFYALVLWRLRGQVPRVLQLVYLGSGEVLRYEPDEADLLATERKVLAIRDAITRAVTTGDWRPSPSRLCSWCDHQALCPAYGGTPPSLPAPVALRPPEPSPIDEVPSPRSPADDIRTGPARPPGGRVAHSPDRTRGGGRSALTVMP